MDEKLLTWLEETEHWCIDNLVAAGFDREQILQVREDIETYLDPTQVDAQDLVFLRDELGVLFARLIRVKIQWDSLSTEKVFQCALEIGKMLGKIQVSDIERIEQESHGRTSLFTRALLAADLALGSSELEGVEYVAAYKQATGLSAEGRQTRNGPWLHDSCAHLSPRPARYKDILQHLRENPHILPGYRLMVDDKKGVICFLDVQTQRPPCDPVKISNTSTVLSRARGKQASRN